MDKISELKIYKKTDNIEKIFKFSIIMAVYNVEDYLNEAIDSIINQTLDFNDNIQLILVDDGSVDNSISIAIEYYEKYPDNIVLISKENEGQSTARNIGLQYALGKYVNFLDSDDYMSRETLENAYNFFEEHEDEIDVLAIPMFLSDRSTGPHRLNHKFEETRIVDLLDEPNYPQLSSSSAFFRKKVFEKFEFPTNLISSEDAFLIAQILLEKKKYALLKEGAYYYRQRFDSTSTTDDMLSRKEYFIDRLKNYFIGLINYCLDNEGEVPEFISYLMAYELQWLLLLPDTDVLNDKEKEEFWILVKKVISYINDEAISENPYVQNKIRSFYMYIKHGIYDIKVDDNKLLMNIGDYNADLLNKHRIWIDIIEIKDGFLNISGLFSSNFTNDSISIYLVKDDTNIEVYECKQIKYTNPSRNTVSFLSIDWLYRYAFDVKVPLDKITSAKFYFKIIYSEGEKLLTFKPTIGFNSSARLSKYSKYQVNNSHILICGRDTIEIKPYKYTSVLKNELKDLKSILFSHENKKFMALFIRLVNLITYTKTKNKKVWLLFDRPDFADDNAKQLFKYATQQDDDIEKYFVVKKDTRYYDELKEISDNIVDFGSLKHKLLYLRAEKIISSYVNENFIDVFFMNSSVLYKGWDTSKRYFLQHGVTKDNVSYFISKFNKNLSLILTVSDLETESFLQEGYNFDKKVIQALGFPRYDILSSNNSKKQILYAPTWRIGLDNEKIFLKSRYYDTLIKFLNNEKLHEILEDNGYELVFRPHPELLDYLDSMDINENVRISIDDPYSQLFEDSSILITDYSSVFFDFAYLEKPVIYYQANDDYHYDEGYFDYNTMGFGEVIKDEDNLISKIKNYIEKTCVMEEEYKTRVHNFFKYHDKNNSKRVYEWIYNN